MKLSRTTMGMPATVEVVDEAVTRADLEAIFDYFQHIDERFSTYKASSEVSQLNAGRIAPSQYSSELNTILELAEQTKQDTHGYFDISRDGQIDPSGIVKGWAIWQAAQQLNQKGFRHFFVDIGADIQTVGYNAQGQPWRIGIRHPWHKQQVVKVVGLSGEGIATSGSYERGSHIYNPHHPADQLNEIQSITIIGPNIYEADRFATAAFAMGKRGVTFIEQQPHLEAYMIDATGTATYTSGFEHFSIPT